MLRLWIAFVVRQHRSVTGVNFTEVYLSLMAMSRVVSVHRTSDRRRLELVQSEYVHYHTLPICVQICPKGLKWIGLSYFTIFYHLGSMSKTEQMPHTIYNV